MTSKGHSVRSLKLIMGLCNMGNEKVIVWRLEDDATRSGVYNYKFGRPLRNITEPLFYKNEGKYNFWSWNFHPKDPHRMPEPREDGIVDFRGGIDYCGFESLRQYYKFFSPIVRKMLAKTTTIKLVAYEVEKKRVKFGKSQVMFERCESEMVKKYSPAHRPRKKVQK